MSLSTKQTAIRVLATSTAVKNAKCSSITSTNPCSSIDPGQPWEGNPSTSPSDIFSDPDTEVESEEVDLDSEAEEILKDIAQAREEGSAKPNHTPYTTKLWKREGDFWER
jgi:hypothetical protein